MNDQDDYETADQQQSRMETKRQAAADILRRWDDLDAERGTWKAHWQDIAEHVIPRKAEINARRGRGEKRTEKQFDGTAADAVDELVATIFNNMTNPAQDWFALRPVGLKGDRQVAMWLDASVEQMLGALSESNFYQQILEALIDLVTVGTAAVYSEEQPLQQGDGQPGAKAGAGGSGFNGFNFRTLPIGEYVIDEDNQGLVDCVYRKFELTARQAVQRWGKDAGESVNLAYEDERRRHDSFEFIHCLKPRDDRKWADLRDVAMPVASTYVAVKDKHVISEGGYHELPIHVARWTLSSGEKYGRSPAMKALPYVKTLNLMVRYGLEALPRALYPPMLVQEGTIVGNTLRLTPGALNQFDGAIDQRPSELVSQARFEIEHAKEEVYRARIEQAFGVDQMRLRATGQMTAEEVIERRARRFQAMAPMTGRVERELLKSLVERCWLMMLGQGAFGEPPRQLAQADRVEVVFQGPLAQSQRRNRINAGLETYQALAPLAQLYPGVLEHFDADGFVRDLAEAMGSGAYLIDGEQVRQAKAQRQQMMQMAQMAQLQGMAAAAGPGSGAVGAGGAGQ